MLDLPTALARLAALPLTSRTERVPLARARGRVLAEAVRMDRDQPAFDRATMDGYAVALDGGRTEFTVRGVVAAGGSFHGTLAPGEAVRIMTGAPVPAGARVVPIELTSAGAAHVPGGGTAAPAAPAVAAVLDPAALAPRRNIARRGEDARAGDTLLAPGTRLGPLHVAAAAMAGARELTVACAPRLAIVTTGDEVGRDSEAGVRDTNGPLLEGLAAELGVTTTREHAVDEAEVLAAALARAAANADVVVTTGGVSMGDKDLVPWAAARLGFETVFHRVAIQPGKPAFLARRAGGALLFGLPGNPVSVLATAHLFLVPALDRLVGREGSRWLTLTMGESHRHDGKRHLFLPAVVDGGLVRPIRWNGSGDLFSAAAGDGLLDLPVGASFERGAPARVLPYVGHAFGERGLLPPREPR